MAGRKENEERGEGEGREETCGERGGDEKDINTVLGRRYYIFIYLLLFKLN